MQDQTIKQQINSREEIVKQLKAAYKLKDHTAERLQRKRAEFLAGFEALGDWHAEQGKMLVENQGQSEVENPEITEENKLIADRHLLKAVALYNMSMASEFYAPRKDEDNESQKITSSEQPIQEQSQQSLSVNSPRFIQKIKAIENQIVLSAGTPVSAIEKTAGAYWQKNQEAKNKLQIIRDQAREALSKITRRNSDDETIEIIEAELPNVQHIYHNIAAGQQQLVRELLDECLQQLPPLEGCIYSIIVLGSLAREEATPYSDFEWAILFEDQGEVRNALHKTYFRRLAELLWIKVLNLGETTSRMMDIEEINGKDEETYGPIPKGFSFDGQMADGCHAPLGNKHHTKASIEKINQDKKPTQEQKAKKIKKIQQREYELIGTLHELAQFQQNTWEHKRGLSTVLSTVAVIQSNDAGLEHSLIEQYEAEMEQIWNTPEEQTDQITGEVTHQTLVQRRSLRFLEESSELFQFRGGRFDKEAHYFDAKYHLYRLPNMLIDHLASYFGITQQKNLWSRIEAIWGEQSKTPNSDAVKNLKRTISTILTIRSQAYLRKGHRDDHILMFDQSHPENQHLLQTYLGINQALLFEIFYVLAPLQFRAEKFIKSKGSLTKLNQGLYYDSGNFWQAWIYELLLNYNKAKKLYKQVIIDFRKKPDENSILFAEALTNLGVIYNKQGKFSKAIEKLNEALSVTEDIHIDGKPIFTAKILNNLGNFYKAKSKFQDAIQVYQKAAKLIKRTEHVRHIFFAEVLNNLGTVYEAQSRYAEALAVYKEAKGIFAATLGEQHVFVANTVGNLGNVYQTQARYTEALAAYETAKRSFIATHGEQHVLVTDTRNNLGLIYKARGQYAEAVDAHEKAKTNYIALHREERIIPVAETLEYLGLVFVEQKRFDKARELFQQAISIYKEFKHPNLQQALNNCATSYLREGNIFLLQEKMDIEQASRRYQLFNQQNAGLHLLEQPAEPMAPQSHQQLAGLFYQSSLLLPTIEHYQILLRLAPNDVSAHHDLACMLHIRAQIEKDKGDEAQYKTYLKDTKSHFETAIGLESNTGVCTEYALFMWKNRDHFQVETIIPMLQKAIKLGQQDHNLGYGMMERPTVVKQLQELIDEENSISFKAIHLAYYLLVQIHCEAHQFESANGNMSLLEAHVIEFDAEIEIQKQQLSDKFNVLLQQATSEQSEAILNRQQAMIKDFEKQQRLANKLVELSQVAIEAKQKEIAELAAQANTEVEQQQIEITEVPDVQSQTLSRPLSGRSTSPAQLIPQFSSVIRQPIAENPSASQQTQISEGMSGPGADRVERVTENADAEHANVRQFSQ